jgi:ADP-heptose:LPS heptosyltransferase
VLKLAEQGSTVLAYPALRRAASLVGPENLYFVVFANNRFILDALEVLPPENVLVVPVERRWSSVFSLLMLFRRIRRLQCDAVVDLEFFSRATAALAFLSGASRRVGFHGFGAGPFRGDLLTHRLLYNPHLHTNESFTALVEALSCDPRQLPSLPAVPIEAEPTPRFTATPEEQAEMEDLLCELPPGERLILLNPNASDLLPLRRWPAERYVQVAHQLLDQHPDARVVFTGGKDEVARTAALAAQVDSPRCLSLAGRTSLRQLLVLYTLADLLVTNDSGPAHFASLTPIDVVVLFGPETPALFAPRSPRTTVLWAGLPCSPCVSALNGRASPCQLPRCMLAIGVDRVVAAANRILARRRPAPVPLTVCH